MSSSLVVQGQGHSLEGNAGCPKQGWSLCEGRDHQRPHPPNPSCAQQTRGVLKWIWEAMLWKFRLFWKWQPANCCR